MAAVLSQEDEAKDEVVQSGQRIVVEGWLYKKANLAIQGYKKRWAQINANGEFVYSKNPASQTRPPVYLRTSSISFNNRYLRIVIDSENCTLHLKFRLRSEYEKWVNEINRLVPSSTADPAELARERSDYDISSFKAASECPQVNINRLKISNNSSIGLLKRLLEHLSDLSNDADAVSSSVPAQEHPNPKALPPSLSKKIHQLTNDLEAFIIPTVENELQRRDLCISSMIKVFSGCPEGASLLRKAISNALESLSNSGALDSPKHSHASFGSMEMFGMPSKRGSLEAINDEEFFDAVEQVYLNNETMDNLEFTSDYDEASAKIASDDKDEWSSSSSEIQKDGSYLSLCTQVEGHTGGRLPTEGDINESPEVQLKNKYVVDHRASLPAPEVPMYSKGLYSLLKNSIGKDLSKVSMPVTLNEPLNTIQKLCQQFEYSELLDEAVSTQDPIMRLCWVTAFSVSIYSASMSMSGRKPFNPLLGETYEMICPSKNLRFIGEKVCQHPSIVACDVTGSDYHYAEQSQTRTKFWGKSIEFIQECIIFLTIPKYNETYTWNKVNSSIRCLFSSKYAMDVYGTLKVASLDNKEYRCELNFRESGYFKSSNNVIEGSIINSSGQKVLSLRGSWDKYLECYKQGSSASPTTLWRSKPRDAQRRHAYGFTPFAVSLNELTDELAALLPKTDTRFRPDQLLYEKGQQEAAEAEKQRLEQKQRDLRKEMELKNEQWVPRWFTPTTIVTNDAKKKFWKFNSHYWDQRGSYINDTPDLW